MMALSSSGGGLLYDKIERTVTRFDSDGTLGAPVGGLGPGPGEYGSVIGIAVREDGRLLIRDGANWKVNVYRKDGSYESQWLVGSDFSSPQSIVVDTADDAYMLIAFQRPGKVPNWQLGMLHLSKTGEFVDSIPMPEALGENGSPHSPFRPQKIWGFSPSGHFVVGWNDRMRLELVRRNAGRVRIERNVSNARLTDNEHQEWELLTGWIRRRLPPSEAGQYPDVPWTKPAYKAIRFSGDGKIWVLRYSTSKKTQMLVEQQRPDSPPEITWIEPEVWSVFGEDGSYFGEFAFPLDTRVIGFGPGVLWAARKVGDGFEVVRLRIIPLS